MGENKESKSVVNDNIEKIKTSLNNITTKESKFLFCVPESENPSASVYEIYFHAKVVSDMGYKVIMLTEKSDYVVPNWIEKVLTDFDHKPMTDSKLTVSPEDIMIIPDIYSNVMEQTSELPCKRIGLLQSFDYMLSALIPGTDWSSFGIRDVIVTSESLRENVELFYGKNKFNIMVYNLGIPDYFKKSDEPQKPIVSVVGRNPNEISKFVKLFYSKFPQYSWVTFDPMLTKSKPAKAMRRVDFANRLKNNFAAIWIDRIASFGTFPVECMKSGVIPIGLKPDLIPEYLIERDEEGNGVKFVEGAGFWTENFYELPLLLGDVLVKFLDDGIKPELYNVMDEVASKYTQESSKEELTNIYESVLNNRIKLFENALKDNDVENK